MNPLFRIPDDFSALSDDELRDWIAVASETAENIAANPAEHIGEGRTPSELMEEMTEGVAAIERARGELAARAETPAEPEPDDGDGETDDPSEPEPEETAALSDDEQEQLAALAARAASEPEPEPEPVPEPETEPESEAARAVTAAGESRRALPRPSRSRVAAPVEQQLVPLTVAAENLGYSLGESLPDEIELARIMRKRKEQFGHIAEGTHGEKIPVAKADWRDLYPEERRLNGPEEIVWEKVQTVTAAARIRAAFEERRKEGGSLVASGGLCAPVTPYYNLQMLSVADRPVRAALPAFNADRGGLRFAAPAALSAVTTAVDIITEEEDSTASTAVKTCQVVTCPNFSEVDVSIIYHCIQFGNLAARTFPELVAQWNQLVLAAHAREAETALLDGIGAASTAVTAQDLGLGASSNIPSQIVVAADGMRSRHRMSPDAVLRVLLPWWVLDLLVSDVYRSQFQRFDMTPEQFVALLRQHNIEPSFYIDGATAAGQVFGAQAAGVLLGFPDFVRWYLYPEGSFLFLDGGTLELGLVRDSVLNETNDFQIFGETFENVAFVGVESLRVDSTICDSGAVSLPVAVTQCGDYS